MKVQHFCEIPQEALCGQYLADNNFKLFYENTTNSFAAVTCQKCRIAIRNTRLIPGRFADPPEWNGK